MIESLKEELDIEKEKVNSLQEIISSNKKVIEFLKDNKQEETADKSLKKSWSADTGIEVIAEKEITATSLIKKKIVKYILKQGNVKTEHVKEDTGELVNTTIHKKDASEKTSVNTSVSIKEAKKIP